MEIYHFINESKQERKKLFALLIDPDSQKEKKLTMLVKNANTAQVDLFLVGGSLLKTDSLNLCISVIKSNSNIPVVLFPGNTMQVNNKADGILFLSLIIQLGE